MDHVSHKTLRNASDELARMESRAPALTVFHTVTLELNGQHGGFDLIVNGVTPNGDEYIDREECH